MVNVQNSEYDFSWMCIGLAPSWGWKTATRRPAVHLLLLKHPKSCPRYQFGIWIIFFYVSPRLVCIFTCHLAISVWPSCMNWKVFQVMSSSHKTGSQIPDVWNSDHRTSTLLSTQLISDFHTPPLSKALNSQMLMSLVKVDSSYLSAIIFVCPIFWIDNYICSSSIIISEKH